VFAGINKNNLVLHVLNIWKFVIYQISLEAS